LSLFQAFFLGILQGATEFLPVSSSGHLVLVPWLLRWQSPGLVFDAVVHWGTAAAVIAYFRDDWLSLVKAAIDSLREGAVFRSETAADGACGTTAAHRVPLPWLIVVGTVPGVLAGYFLQDFFEGMFARPAAAAGFLLLTAGLLAASEWLGRRERDLGELGWLDALVVGAGQALAILPGVSRSGATIAAALARGIRREPAARFSFLLATPIILGAGLLKVGELVQMGGLAMQGSVLLVGFLSAAVVGFGSIHILLRYLQRRRLYAFALYCAVFGIFCLVVRLVR
jgi:undecaprenyl-diphosphatase